MNLFLIEEWKDKKKSKVYYYNSLSKFLNEKFSNIKLKNQTEKDLEIIKLGEASTYAEVKIRLHKLATYNEFTDQQLNNIIEVAINNNQLFWIKTDRKIAKTLMNIIKDNENRIDVNLLYNFNKIYKPIIQEIEENSKFNNDLPF